MTSWYPAVTAVFNDKTITKVKFDHDIIALMTNTKGLKGERLRSFYSCVSALLSIQVSNTISTQLFDEFLLLKRSSCSIM